MSWTKLTPADKRNITKDWHELFPSLGIYEPMHLLNRIGPFLVGILLHVKSGNDRYIPTFHITNLAKDFMPDATLELETTLNRQDVSLFYHSKRVVELSPKMKETAWIPFDNDLNYEEIMTGLRNYSNKAPLAHQFEGFEAMIVLSQWCNRNDDIEDILEFAAGHFAKWYKPVLENLGRVEGCINRLKVYIKGSDEIHRICDQQARKIKADKLPVRLVKC